MNESPTVFDYTELHEHANKLALTVRALMALLENPLAVSRGDKIKRAKNVVGDFYDRFPVRGRTI